MITTSSKKSQENLEMFAVFFVMLKPYRKKIFRRLWWYHQAFPNSFPTISKLAKAAGVSERSVQRLFNEIKNLDKYRHVKDCLKIMPRTNRMGGSSSNEYVLHRDFVLALEWLQKRGKLNASAKEVSHLILSMENKRICHPPPPNLSPLSSIKYSNTFYQTLGGYPPSTPPNVWLHPKLKELPMLDDLIKLYASKYASEHEIVDALEACLYQEREKRKIGQRILNPSSYFYRVLKNKMKHRTAR